MSMDLFLSSLSSEDFLMDGGLGALSSEDVMIRLKSAEFVKDLLLPNTAATAAAAVNAEEPSTSNNGKPQSQQEKIGKLRANLERRITGDDIVPLNMNFRMSSGDWVKDFEAESVNLMAMHMHTSLFMGNHPSLFMSNARGTSQLSTSPPPLNFPTDNYEECEIPLRSSGHQPASMPTLTNLRISSRDWVKDFNGESVDSGPMHPSLFLESIGNASNAATAAQFSTSPPTLNSPTDSNEEHQMHLAYSQRQSKSMPPLTNSVIMNRSSATSRTATLVKTPQASPTTSKNSKKKKKSRKRTLDETCVVEQTDGDVLSGRGGFTNTHPGNIRFRKKALEFRPWYEQSSKEEKQKIADMLVESVKSEGHRFLGKGKDGLWHEIVGNGAHHKASQALRERIKGGNDK